MGDSEDEDDAPTDEIARMPQDDLEDTEEGGLAQPCKPSQAEVDEHNRSHTPFRSWCEICVRASAVEDPHRPNKVNENNTLVV